MHDFSQEEWKEEELEQLYSTHEALIDTALLFCFVPRDRYLPLGPIRYAAMHVVAQLKWRGVQGTLPATEAALLLRTA